MKTGKKVLLAAALLMASSAAFSQAQFALGIKGGPNFANLNVHDARATYDSRTGFHFGAFALFKFTKVGIQPEVLFSQQGSKVTYNTNTSFTSNFSYVNVPVLLKLYTIAGINLQAGPQFGFLTNDPIVKDPTTGVEIKDAYKKSNTSLALGVGWDLPFGLTLDGRYNLGLSKIDNSSVLATTKSQVWQVSVGFKLIKMGK